MVVYQNDGRRALRNGLTEHLARMYERRIENAARDSHVALQTMLRVENGDMELLDRKILEARGEHGHNITRRANRRAFVPVFSCHPSSQLQCRMYHDRARSTDA